MQYQFQRILDLVRRTGDRMVIMDPEGNQPFVIMDIDQYEMLLDFDGGFSDDDHEEEEFEDFSEEIQESESDNIKLSSPEPEKDLSSDIWKTLQSANTTGETWDLSRLTTDELCHLEQAYQQFVEEKCEKVDCIAEEEASDKENLNDSGKDFGEEQFYLEPIE